jgi:hypothetical protein
MSDTYVHADLAAPLEAAVGPCFCDACGKETLVLDCDGSAGEYASVRMCMPCIRTLFARYRDEVEHVEQSP